MVEQLNAISYHLDADSWDLKKDELLASGEVSHADI